MEQIFDTHTVKIFLLSRNHGLKSQQNRNLADLRGLFLSRPSLPHGYFWIFVESLVDTFTLQQEFHGAVKALVIMAALN